MKIKAKTDTSGKILCEMENQNPIRETEDPTEPLDIIAGIMFLRMKSKDGYAKRKLTDCIEDLFRRYYELKKLTIYNCVPDSFVVGFLAKRLNRYLGVYK